jgi:hypothetical protein
VPANDRWLIARAGSCAPDADAVMHATATATAGGWLREAGVTVTVSD